PAPPSCWPTAQPSSSKAREAGAVEIVVNLAFVVFLALLGLIVGSLLEGKHYRSIRERETQYRHILLFNEKRPPLAASGQPFHLVQGAVVISSDYFKNMAAGLRSLFGGRLKN